MAIEIGTNRYQEYLVRVAEYKATCIKEYLAIPARAFRKREHHYYNTQMRMRNEIDFVMYMGRSFTEAEYDSLLLTVKNMYEGL